MDDSSENPGGTEECCSNESGWTMYIASPIHGNNPKDEDDDDDHDNSTERKEYTNFRDDDEDVKSDDSMASDASSRPSYRGGPCRTTEGSHSSDDFKHAEREVNRRSLGKKRDKQVENKRYAAETKAANQVRENKGKSAGDNVHSKGKSRKNLSTGRQI